MEVIIQEFQNLINQEYLALKELEKAPSKPDFKNVRRMLDELTHILSQYPVAKGDDRSLIIANAAISALANLNLSLLRYLGKIDTSSTSPDTYII